MDLAQHPAFLALVNALPLDAQHSLKGNQLIIKIGIYHCTYRLYRYASKTHSKIKIPPELINETKKEPIPLALFPIARKAVRQQLQALNINYVTGENSFHLQLPTGEVLFADHGKRRSTINGIFRDHLSVSIALTLINSKIRHRAPMSIEGLAELVGAESSEAETIIRAFQRVRLCTIGPKSRKITTIYPFDILKAIHQQMPTKDRGHWRCYSPVPFTDVVQSVQALVQAYPMAALSVLTPAVGVIWCDNPGALAQTIPITPRLTPDSSGQIWIGAPNLMSPFLDTVTCQRRIRWTNPALRALDALSFIDPLIAMTILNEFNLA